MSSDQRIKKLRGSGGYVMASVNDDQQRKGNLGGPDLFLAPVGRLDSEKITRYFCNTCEKDYEGSPKVEFENPNEVVAENLVLAERGQYLCLTCGSTIAEYREFSKQDELGDVGMAKPMERDPEPPLSEPVSDTSFMEAPPIEPPSTVGSSERAESPDAEPSEVKSIAGMSVFDENGIKCGTAKQVGVDSAQNIVLTITKNDGGDLAIPWGRIKKIGEIILLGDGTAPVQAEAAGTCPGCGFANKGDSKFCEQCGNKI